MSLEDFGIKIPLRVSKSFFIIGLVMSIYSNIDTIVDISDSRKTRNQISDDYKRSLEKEDSTKNECANMLKRYYDMYSSIQSSMVYTVK